MNEENGQSTDFASAVHIYVSYLLTYLFTKADSDVCQEVSGKWRMMRQ